MAACIGHGMF